MKTTIDIPESLYRKAKIRAVERGTTLRSLMLNALELDLAPNRMAVAEERAPYFTRRKLLPEYKAAMKAGSFRKGTDSSRIIAEERDAR